MRELSELMLALFQGALDKTVEQYKDWALGEVCRVIPFDSALWAAGAWIDGRPQTHSMHLHRMSPDFPQSWMRHQHEDRLIRDLTEQTNNTFNINIQREYGGQAIYAEHCKPHGMEHILATAATHADTRLLNVICLYRNDPANGFDDAMRERKELLFPHLIETARANWMLNLGKPESHARATPHAASDSQGVLHVAMPAFVELCQREWPGWKGPTLPYELVDALTRTQASYRGQRITIDSRPSGELTLLCARLRGAVDELTKREAEVAQLYAQGMDYKTIAKQIGLSPTTVRTHLTRTYEKLGVGDKAQLAKMLYPVSH